jgi:hypothetical protein
MASAGPASMKAGTRHAIPRVTHIQRSVQVAVLVRALSASPEQRPRAHGQPAPAVHRHPAGKRGAPCRRAPARRPRRRISSDLFRTLEQPDVYMSVLLEDDEGIAHGNDWARGFMRGVQARPASWRELIVSDEHGGSLIPIMLLAHEHDPDPAMRPKPVAPDKREEILQMMIAGLTKIYLLRAASAVGRGRFTAGTFAPRRAQDWS